ncbi:MAG: hypothetical protein ABIR80_05125, partial [Opitutaceae bacterium]
MRQPRTSRERYRAFVQAYKARRLDDEAAEEKAATAKPGADAEPSTKSSPASKSAQRAKRRGYLRDYLRWLRPHRYGIVAVFAFALAAAGLQMIEPLFMRFIVDRVLLNTGLDSASRLGRLQLAGVGFLAVVLLSNLISALKDYRQR